ncbi:hypothetical protein F511_22378 [Dorcoceras hygrometricum]|uniref:Dystroglycan-like n=1 Tax=Dorcoceras hygrometricum TaxID=472368 RepID=A0A2Z7A767_9LAMI|nr:hypothetical protein F511_22378 [Dorcoceras hygrometricum]
MASSLISNSHHIVFDAVFGMEDTDLVQMFESLIATGLKNFLGCTAVFNEDALTEFFDGLVFSTVNGVSVEISEEGFAATFEQPVDGMTDLSEVPKNLVFDARSLFSISKEQVSISCLKKAMKIQYRLLHDILAKKIYVKAGSFDSVTRDRFMLMIAITFDVKINWSSLLFGVLREMVTPGSRQDKGYAIQICVLLRNVPRLELGESKTFPIHRVLNERTVHRYVVINDKLGGEEVVDAPKVKRTPMKNKGVTKKRPAAGDAEDFDEEFTTAYQENQDSEDEIDFDIDNQELPVFDETRTVPEAGGSKSFGVDKAGEKPIGSKHTTEEHMSIDDLLMQISEDMMLPSITAAEITKIRLGGSINIHEVQEHDLYYASLPRISLHDKGKEILEEYEPVRGNPAMETVELICGDVDFLVQLRNKVMQDVVEFFHSFSLNKLTDLDGLKALKSKESLMLNWAETDSLEMATWTTKASKIIDLLSVSHSKSLEDLIAQQKEQGLPIEQPCTSTFLDTSVGRCCTCPILFSGQIQIFGTAKVLIDGVWTPIVRNQISRFVINQILE